MQKLILDRHVQVEIHVVVVHVVDQDAVVQKVNQQDVPHVIVMAIVILVVQAIT